MEELKPCPFCGGEAEFYSSIAPASHRPCCFVYCKECKSKTDDFVADDCTFSYKYKAKEAWNRRA